jgi:hypothetical protein
LTPEAIKVRNKKDAVALKIKRDSDTPGVKADRIKYDAARKKETREMWKIIATHGQKLADLLQLRSLPTIDT